MSLAQDRGRLEARVEVLTTELETQRKHSEQDGDALRIKAKIIDDQTATIRKLKEVMPHSHYMHPSTDGGFLTHPCVFFRVVLQRGFHWTVLAYICITRSDWATDPSLP